MIKGQGYKSRFKKVWDDKDAMKSGLIHKVSPSDVKSISTEQHKPEVIEKTKGYIK